MMVVTATQRINSTNIHTTNTKSDNSLYRHRTNKATLLTATVAYPPTAIKASRANGESEEFWEVNSSTPTGWTKTTNITASKKDNTKKSKIDSLEVINRTIDGKLSVWSVFISCLFYPKYSNFTQNNVFLPILLCILLKLTFIFRFFNVSLQPEN